MSNIIKYLIFAFLWKFLNPYFDNQFLQVEKANLSSNFLKVVTVLSSDKYREG